MNTAISEIVKNIAAKYFEDFPLNDVQDFFSAAFMVNPSLKEDIIQANTPAKLQTFLADAVKVIETQAAGTYTANNNLLQAIRGLSFSD